MSDLFVDNTNTSNNSNTSNTSTTLVFSNDQNLSYNQIKSKILSNLSKANKVLDEQTFKKLKQELITNMRNNNNFVVSIDDNGNYSSEQAKDDIFSGGLSDESNNNNNEEDSESSSEGSSEQGYHANTEENLLNSETDDSSSSNESTEVVTEVVPEVVTEVVPEVVTEVVTEVVPEVVTEVVPEVVPEVVTEVVPEVVTEVVPEVVTMNLSKRSGDKELFSGELSSKENTEVVPEVDTKNHYSWLNYINPFKGGNKSDSEDYDSEFEQTYMIESDENDEESFVDNAKLNSTKYLKTLNVKDLRDIMRDNNIQLSKNGLYLKKKEMITKISKNFK